MDAALEAKLLTKVAKNDNVCLALHIDLLLRTEPSSKLVENPTNCVSTGMNATGFRVGVEGKTTISG